MKRRRMHQGRTLRDLEPYINIIKQQYEEQLHSTRLTDDGQTYAIYNILIHVSNVFEVDKDDTSFLMRDNNVRQYIDSRMQILFKQYRVR